jgi:anti-sigma regulatory factor (Ser/Thr protein kinase)
MTEATLWSHQTQLPAEDESVPRARHFVRNLLIDHRFLNLVEDVRLVVSELATNAIRHANTPFTVTLQRVDQSVLLTVTDGSSVPPVQLATDLLETGGRGLSIVDLLSGDWGVIRRGDEGKSVWASFGLRAGTRQRGSVHLGGDEDFEEHLNAALVTRPTIEQAKGVLVTLRAATPDQAFAELRHASQTHNVKLRRLADALVETASGRTPDDPELRKVIWREWGRLFPGRL